jgi:hypothetical protein
MWVLLHGALDIMGLRYNAGIAYVTIFNDGRLNSSVQILLKKNLVYGSIMLILYKMYIGIIGILYHDMGTATRIPSHSIDFKM